MTPRELRSLDVLARMAADLIDRKQAEESLRLSEERFRALINASSQVLYRLSPDWSEMRQLQGGNFMADTEKPNPNWLQEYIYPDDQKWVLEVIDMAVRTGTVFELEHRVLRIDGTLGWTSSRAVPVRNADGEIVEWFGAASDITDRKQTEEALRKSEETLRFVVENSPDSIFIQDRDLRYVWVGRPAHPLWREDYFGRTDHDLAAPEDAARLTKIKQQVLTEGKKVEVELELNLRDEAHIFNAIYKPWRDAAGEIIGLAGYVRDITRQKRMEEELRRSRDELELRVEDRTAELIRANKALQEEIFQRKQVQEELGKKTQLLTAILNSLPVGVWITDNQGKIIEANPAAKEVWGGAQYVGVKDYVEYKGWWAETGERIEAREWALARAFKKGGNDSHEIHVEDNGIGFDEEYLDRIFSPFQRLHGRSSSYEGTGMGLAICKKIMERHGGSITAESLPGKGSTFVVTLPMKY